MKQTMRVINVLAVLMLIGAAVAVYQIKYQATWQAVEVERLNRQIEREKRAIQILEAEWAHLKDGPATLVFLGSAVLALAG